MASKLLCVSITFVFLVSCYVVSAIKCNGMEKLCDLRLNEVTLPGTHNSGSGFNGHLYHWSGGIAASRLWRNQQWDFTKQLDYGIRYFDIDTCYVDKDYDDWWTKGAWICHMGAGTAAYAGPVKKMLKQINDWLNKPEHANEVIIIKFGRDVEVDYKPDKIYESILHNLNEIGWKPTPKAKQAKNLTANDVFGPENNYNWPTLREAIKTNQRVFLFLSEKLLQYGYEKPSEDTQQPWLLTAEWEIKITWPNILKFTASCSGIVPKIVENCEKFLYSPGLLELDVFASSVARSTWSMQASCDKYMQEAMDKCFDVRKTKHRTVNAVLADWVNRSKSPNTVLEVAKKQNKRNIAMYGKSGSKGKNMLRSILNN